MGSTTADQLLFVSHQQRSVGPVGPSTQTSDAVSSSRMGFGFGVWQVLWRRRALEGVDHVRQSASAARPG